MQKLRHVKNKVNDWYKSVFGDVRSNKTDVLREITENDSVEEEGLLSNDMVNLRADLRNEFEVLLFREVTSWRQKSRC